MIAVQQPDVAAAFGSTKEFRGQPEKASLVPVHAPPIALLGVPFDHVTMAEAVERIEQMVASRAPHYVVTANVDFLVQARRDIELRRILLDAHLSLCDGTPLVWASRLLGNPLLTVNLGPNAGVLTVPGTATSWASSGAVLGADSFADVTYTATSAFV